MISDRAAAKRGGGRNSFPSKGFWSENFKMGKQPSKSISRNFQTAKWPVFLSEKVNMKAAWAESEVEVNAPPHAWWLAALLLTKVIKSFPWLMATSPPPGGFGLCKCFSHPEGSYSALMSFFTRHDRLGVDEPSKAIQLNPKLSKSWNLTLKRFRWWCQGNSCSFVDSGFVSSCAVFGSLWSLCDLLSKNNISFETKRVLTGQCRSGDILFVDSSGILIMRWTLLSEQALVPWTRKYSNIFDLTLTAASDIDICKVLSHSWLIFFLCLPLKSFLQVYS